MSTCTVGTDLFPAHVPLYLVVLRLQLLLFVVQGVESRDFHNLAYRQFLDIAWQKTPGVGDLVNQESPGVSFKSSATSASGISLYARCTAAASVM